MRKNIERTVSEVEVSCDVCSSVERELLYIKSCKMCGKDLCYGCAILTDFTNLLEKNSYNGDYPDYICRECWDIGKNIRKDIMQIRHAAENNENELMAEWKKLCSAVEVKND